VRRFIAGLIKLAAVTLFLMVIVMAGTFFLVRYIVKSGQAVETPNVVGTSLAEALEVVGATGLELKPDGWEYHPLVEENHIISQRPAPGRVVKSTRKLYVIISRGNRLIRLPDLAGKPLREAEIALERAGLQSGRTSRTYYPARRDTVVAQDPKAGQYAPKGSPVNLLVSRGISPRTYLLPSLSGMGVEPVTKMLNELNLSVEARREFTLDVPDGIVFAQEPKPNMVIEEGSIVTLKISSGTSLPRWRDANYAIVDFVVPLALRDWQLKIVSTDLVPDYKGQYKAQVEWPETPRGISVSKVKPGTAPPGTKITIPVWWYDKPIKIETLLNGALYETRYVSELEDVNLRNVIVPNWARISDRESSLDMIKEEKPEI